MNGQQSSTELLVPLLPGQRAILSGLAASPASYLIHKIFRSSARLSVDRVQDTARALWQSCPALRVRLCAGPQGLAQRFDGIFPQVQVKTCALRDVEAQVGQVELDPLGDTVWRITLLRLPDADLLVMSFHHFAVDGASVDVIGKRFWRAYDQAGELPLPVDAGSYIDAVYEVCSRRELSEWDGQRPPACLIGKTADVGRVLEDGPDPAHDGGNVFSPQEIAALEALATSLGVTLSTVLMLAYALLLARLSGSMRITIGIPVSLRDVEASELIGPFFNTLPVVIDLEAGASVAQAITEAAEALWSALSLRDVPTDELAAAGGASGRIFDCLYVYDYESDRADAAAVPAREEVEVEPKASEFLMTLAARRAHGALALRWELSPDLGIGRGRIPIAYRRLLMTIEADPAASIGSLVMPAAAAAQDDASGWNLESETILDMLCRRFESHPDRIALVCGRRAMSYGELHRSILALAGALRRHGVGPGARVLIHAPRDERLPALLLAVLWTGAAYVPIDGSWPAERIASLMNEIAPVLVVGDVSVGGGFRRVAVDVLHSEAEQGGEAEGPHCAGSEEIAYVIYTSGSLGRPKGVVVRHRSVAHLARASRQRLQAYGLSLETAVIGWTASIAFDASIEGLAQLCYGTALCIVPREALFDTDRLRSVLDEAHADVLDCTPAIARVLLADASFVSARPVSLLIGGESIDACLWRQVQAYCRSHDVHAFNMYGPTEACVTCAIESIQDCEGPSVGRPTGASRFELTDADGAFLTGGDVSGELWISGPGLGVCYLDRPEETRAAFRVVNGRRYYRTGDRMRRRRDGRYVFLGRVDEQVKVNGFRIELDEVRSALAACADVCGCGVAVRTAPGGVSRLVAAVVVRRSDGATARGGEAIRSEIARTLPAYMVPDEVRIVETLPLTSSDKISTENVLALFESPRELAAPAADDTELEARLRDVWERALGTAQFGKTSRFSEVGGHSLQLAHLRALIHQEFAVRLDYELLSRHPTIEAQLTLLRQSPEAARTTQAPTRRAEVLPGTEDRVARLMEEYDVPNAQVSSIVPGKTLHLALAQAGGCADVAARFRLTCIQKLLHTAIVLHAHQRGHIGLYDDLREEIPELSGAAYPIRLHDVLRFAGGFDNTLLPAIRLSGECVDSSSILRRLAAAQVVPPGGVPGYGDEGTLIADAVLIRRGLGSTDTQLSRLLAALGIDQSASIAPPDPLSGAPCPEGERDCSLALSGSALSRVLQHVFLSGEYLNGESVDSYLAHSLAIPASAAYDRMTYGAFVTDDFIAFASDGIVHSNFIAIRPSTREILSVHAAKVGAGQFLDSVARGFGMRYLNDAQLPVPVVQPGLYHAAIGTLRIERTDVGELGIDYTLRYRYPDPRFPDSEGRLVFDGVGGFVPQDPVVARATGGFAFFVENGMCCVRIRHWLFRKCN